MLPVPNSLSFKSFAIKHALSASHAQVHTRLLVCEIQDTLRTDTPESRSQQTLSLSRDLILTVEHLLQNLNFH